MQTICLLICWSNAYAAIVTELASHFFRNIHNQIKQQMGKPVRETVLSVPSGLSEAVKSRLLEAAQAGGLRIKSFIEDTAATVLAYDIPSLAAPAKALVLDIGWSRAQVAVFSVSGGAVIKLSDKASTAVSGKMFVNAVADHCAKEFARKAKTPCADNTRAMMRLRRECEAAVKALSTGAEATIDIDSLCEGIDFSCKISRARFEDLCGTGFIQIRNMIQEAILAAGIAESLITHVCMSGGLSAVPKVAQVVKAILPAANFPKLRIESSEAQCVGAALHARDLASLV
jgi:heat shock protein 1/8